MSETIPAVLAIGSCRIFRPLRRLHDMGRINLLNYTENYWFTHTAAAGRQYVDVMQGRKSIPSELRRAALETEAEYAGDMNAGLPAADVAVVEVSSLKQHRIGSYELNAHKVYGIAVETGLPYQPIVNGHVDNLPEDHVLKPLVVEYTTGPELAADLLAIRENVGAPIILVDHLYALTGDGGPVPGRDRLTDELRSFSGEHGVPFYATKDLILEAGLGVALSDQNHYREEFEPVVAERLLPMVISAASPAP